MKLKIEYSIVSPGTERGSGTLGYMALTGIYKNSRFVLPLPHSTKCAYGLEHGLNCKQFDIANIAFSRFQLISALNFGRLKLKKNDKILVCGLGCVGLGAILELHRLKCKDVEVLSQKENAGQILAKINNTFNVVRNTDFQDYNYIIDSTGSGEFLNDLIIKAKNFSNIVVLGTPRLNNNIEVLLIHRKNITLYGFHEINGYSDDKRNNVFGKLLQNNIEVSDRLKDIICYYPFTNDNRKLCLQYNNKQLRVNIFKYE